MKRKLIVTSALILMAMLVMPWRLSTCISFDPKDPGVLPKLDSVVNAMQESQLGFWQRGLLCRAMAGPRGFEPRADRSCDQRVMAGSPFDANGEARFERVAREAERVGSGLYQVVVHYDESGAVESALLYRDCLWCSDSFVYATTGREYDRQQMEVTDLGGNWHYVVEDWN